MKLSTAFITVAALLAAVAWGADAPKKPQLVEAKDGSGVVGYKDTPIQPWSGYHVHDPDRPLPKKVDPGQPSCFDRAGKAPSDALVLFDGKDMNQWVAAPEWKIEDGMLVAGKGHLYTKEQFGNCQVHIEFQAPNPPQGDRMNRGNNGVLMMGMTEIQIFDTWSTQLYPDGQCAAIYAQTPPLVNVTRKPGDWQTYDILWKSPVYKDGKMIAPARLTLLHNGVLVHLDQEIYGATPHRQLSTYPDQRTQGPLALMGHNNPVKFRNLWIRKLETLTPSVKPAP